MAPVVVKGKVLVGNSGGELGVRGWVTALDENTGAIAWRAYATGPDKDVLIGDDFRPFYDNLKGKDLPFRKTHSSLTLALDAGILGRELQTDGQR